MPRPRAPAVSRPAVSRSIRPMRLARRGTPGPAGPTGSYSALGYRAATIERSSGRGLPTGGSADVHLRYDLDLLRRMGQAFDRDNSIYAGIVNRAVENILGPGFKLEARTDDEKTNAALEAWNLECGEDPEVRGLDEDADLEAHTLRHVMTDGDLAYLKTDTGQLQAIEAERILGTRCTQGQKTELGVELNPLGRPLAYWIADYDALGYLRRGNPRRYDAAGVLFIAHRRRFSQTRGVPVQIPAYPMIHRLNDVCDSEAIAWQLLSRFALACYRDGGPERGFIESEEDPEKGQPPNMDTRVQNVGEAIIFHAQGNDKLAPIARDLPGANFPESVRTFLRLVGLPFGLPLELILLDWSQTNYSSARAALEQAHRNFLRWQRFLIRNFHRPLYRWRVDLALAKGIVRPRADLYKHEWITPKFPWLDVLKEAKAWGEALDRGFSTQTEILATRGLDREEFLVQRTKEIRAAIEAANELNKDFPDANVDWRIFAGLQTKAATAPQPAVDETGLPIEAPDEALPSAQRRKGSRA